MVKKTCIIQINFTFLNNLLKMQLADLKLYMCSHSISTSTGWCWVQHSLAAQSCVFQGVAKAFWMGQVITESDSLGWQRIFRVLSLQSLQTSHNDSHRWHCDGIVGVGVAFLPLIGTLEVDGWMKGGGSREKGRLLVSWGNRRGTRWPLNWSLWINRCFEA